MTTTPPLTNKPWFTWLTHIRDAFPHHTPKRDWFVEVFKWLEYENYELTNSDNAEEGFELRFKSKHALVIVRRRQILEELAKPAIIISDNTESWEVIATVLSPLEPIKRLISLANPEVENHIPKHP